MRLTNIKNISFRKSSSIIKDFPSVCEMSYKSYEYIERKKASNTNMHPIIPTRGEIYNAFIADNVTIDVDIAYDKKPYTNRVG